MKRITPSCRSMFFYLYNRYKYFSRKEKLQKDGSFYITDERLADAIDVTVKTIGRCRKKLEQAGLIKCISGKHKGWASSYWIISKLDIISSKGDKMSGFDCEVKVDKISSEVDKMSIKGRQNVTPLKEYKNDNKKENCTFEEVKQGFKNAVKLLGMEKAKASFLRVDYTAEQITELIDSLNE